MDVCLVKRKKNLKYIKLRNGDKYLGARHGRGASGSQDNDMFQDKVSNLYRLPGINFLRGLVNSNFCCFFSPTDPKATV